jgi:hypothetical protein
MHGHIKTVIQQDAVVLSNPSFVRLAGIRHNTISVATLRADGFAGWRKSEADGSNANSSRLTTRAVNITGPSLFVTLDVAAEGELRVGFLDASTGAPLPDFRISDW